MLLITTTSGRPQAFEYLTKWIKNQTFEEIEWLVVSDNADEYRIPKKCKLVEIDKQPGNSMVANWKAVLEWIETNGQKHERFAVIEDDDYYAPNYLYELNKMLDKADLVGFNEDAYYFVLSRRSHRCHNRTMASLAATGFKRSVLPALQEIVAKGKTTIDAQLWESWKGSKLLCDNFDGRVSGTSKKLDKNGMATELPRHVGVKENWHKGAASTSGYPLAGGFDVYGKIAKRWFGEDAPSYLKFTRDPAIGTPGILIEIPDRDNPQV